MLSKWQYEVLTTGDREAWRSTVEAIPARDIFFTPEYLIPFEHLSGNTAHLFVFGDGTNYIICPYFLRRINDLPFYQEFPLNSATEYFDIVSPYGYSGPLAYVKSQAYQLELWQEYLSSFHQYCQQTRIVCEFARLNPFAGNQHYLQELTNGVRPNNPITYLDLTVPEDELWGGLNRGNRSNINKARRAGVSIDLCKDDRHLQHFYRLYKSTMRRNNASEWYYFSPDFWNESFTLLDDKITLFCAGYNNTIIAAASFLHEGETVHYFLGGSDSNYLALRPNNLLMYQAILWAKSQGYKFFNLGGAYGDNDDLARFKAAFSKLTITFYTYRMIHNKSVYDELCQNHQAYYLMLGQQACNTNFFPQYRTEN